MWVYYFPRWDIKETKSNIRAASGFLCRQENAFIKFKTKTKWKFSDLGLWIFSRNFNGSVKQAERKGLLSSLLICIMDESTCRDVKKKNPFDAEVPFLASSLEIAHYVHFLLLSFFVGIVAIIIFTYLNTTEGEWLEGEEGKVWRRRRRALWKNKRISFDKLLLAFSFFLGTPFDYTPAPSFPPISFQLRLHFLFPSASFLGFCWLINLFTFFTMIHTFFVSCFFRLHPHAHSLKRESQKKRKTLFLFTNFTRKHVWDTGFYKFDPLFL